MGGRSLKRWLTLLRYPCETRQFMQKTSEICCFALYFWTKYDICDILDFKYSTQNQFGFRRGTLAPDANEQHLGLDDTDLMLRTVQAEFNLKNLFAK